MLPNTPGPRPLLPKPPRPSRPPPPPDPGPSAVARRAKRRGQTSKACPIPQCRRLDCQLRTHHQHVRPARPVGDSPAASGRDSTSSNGAIDHMGPRSAADEGQASLAMQGLLRTVPRNGDLHGLEALPDVVSEAPVFRILLHEFCVRVHDRLSLLFAPPPINEAGRIRALSMCMTSPEYLLYSLAAVQISSFAAQHDDITKKDYHPSDRISAMLYAKVMEALRLKVANFDFAEIDNLLLLITSLATFDVSRNNLAYLTVHRRGMDQLVTKKGGVHNLTHSLHFVMNLDRILAIYLGALPLYARPVDPTFQRASRIPLVYGSFFASDQSRITPIVRTFCSDVCRVMEIFEHGPVSFHPAAAHGPACADVFYFYFIRERTANQFIELNAALQTEQSPSRAVLLATKILDYIILVDNFIRAIPIFLASKLQDSISAIEAAAWDGQPGEDVLLWILFVLLVMPNPWKGHAWALDMLRKRLNLKYDGSAWPPGWRQEELRNVRRFLWCDTRLDAAFLKACEELVARGGDGRAVGDVPWVRWHEI